MVLFSDFAEVKLTSFLVNLINVKCIGILHKTTMGNRQLSDISTMYYSFWKWYFMFFKDMVKLLYFLLSILGTRKIGQCAQSDSEKTSSQTVLIIS